MDQALHHMPTLNVAKNAVEIVVHVSENLEDQQRRDLVSTLEQEDGIEENICNVISLFIYQNIV